MNTNNLITEVFTDIETGQFEKAKDLLSDNFKSVVLGKEVNRPIYLSVYRSLLKGIPDLRFDLQHVKQEGGNVSAQLKVSGTNSHAIPALMRGWHEIPATNKKVDGLIMYLEISLKDDKIAEIKNAKNKRGMFTSLFENLGIDYKKAQEN